MICMTDSTEFTLTQLINFGSSKRGGNSIRLSSICVVSQKGKSQNAVKLSNIFLLKGEPKIYYTTQDNAANSI